MFSIFFSITTAAGIGCTLVIKKQHLVIASPSLCPLYLQVCKQYEPLLLDLVMHPLLKLGCLSDFN